MTKKNEDCLRQLEILERVREIYASYLSLSQINSGVDPTFVIKHLTQVFGQQEEIGANGSGNGKREEQKEPQNEIYDKICTLYRVFRTLCKWEVDDASEILIDALGNILSELPDAEIPTDDNASQNSTPPPLEETLKLNDQVKGNFKQKAPANPQIFNIETVNHFLPEGETRENLNPRPRQNLKFKNEPKVPFLLTSASKSKSASPFFNPLEQKPEKSCILYECAICTKSFHHFEARDLHQVFCVQSPINKKSKSNSSSFLSRDNIKPKTKDNPRRSLRKKSKSPPKLEPELELEPSSESIAVAIATSSGNKKRGRASSSRPIDNGSCSMRKRIKRVIATASRRTLTSFGYDLSALPTPDKKFLCHHHLCQGQGKNIDFGSRERLADHIRSHSESKQRETPFKCFHLQCQKRFRSARSFRIHLKYPHEQNGNFTKVRNSEVAPKLKISISKVTNGTMDQWKISNRKSNPKMKRKRQTGVKKKTQISGKAKRKRRKQKKVQNTKSSDNTNIQSQDQSLNKIASESSPGENEDFLDPVTTMENESNGFQNYPDEAQDFEYSSQNQDQSLDFFFVP